MALAALLLGLSSSSAWSAPPARIVSLSPATTEILFALGAGPRVVGVTRYCDHPKEVLRLPRVGGFLDPNLEAILALRPELVVVSPNGSVRGVVNRLTALGTRVVAPYVDSLDQVEKALVLLGDAVGESARGRTLSTELAGRVGAVRARVKGRRRPRVLVVHGQRPLIVAGRGTYADELVSIAGGDNVGAQGRARYPMLSPERLLMLDPEVIIDATGEEGSLAPTLARLGTVSAVRTGRVVRLKGAGLTHPGPRLGATVEELTAILHP